MDEFNRDIDPINEYQSIDSENTPASNQENANENVVTPDSEDVFEAFEKAEKETVANSQNPQQNFGADAQQTPPQYHQSNYTEQSSQYSQPQYTVPNYTQPQYTVPPYMPPQYPQPHPQQPYAQPQQPYAQPQQPPYQQGAYNQPPQYGNVAHTTYNRGSAQYQQPQPNSNYNPYAQQQSAVKPKEKTPKKTKILIGVLIGLLVVFMIAFFASCCAAVFGNNSSDNTSDNPLSQYGTESPFDSYEDYFGDNSNGFNILPQYDGQSFEEDITLQADEGQTQQRSDSNDDNTYEPDEDAKGIELNSLPKDKDDSKYTTQSAYNTVSDSVVSVLCYDGEITDNEEDIQGEGTGTIISADGYIVTNSHVISDSTYYTINVVLNNAKEYQAKVVGYDTRTDLAVLKIDAKDLTYAKFSDSSLVEIGQDVVAIGNPGGQSFQNSLTKGIVSAVDRELALSANVKYIQIDAAINPGNSGGPLCNIYGQVIGINTAKISSSEYEGMGFAIPSSTVAEIANDLIKYGYVKDRVMLGLVGVEVDSEMISYYNVPNGILITEITENGPLDNTDVEPYDILTEVNGVEVSTFQEVFAELAKYKAGDEITLTFYRLETK